MALALAHRGELLAARRNEGNGRGPYVRRASRLLRGEVVYTIVN
jgi:hypothetical protein